MKFVGISDEIPEFLSWDLGQHGYIVKNFMSDSVLTNYDDAKKRMEGFKKSGYMEIESRTKNERHTKSFYVFIFDNGSVDD